MTSGTEDGGPEEILASDGSRISAGRRRLLVGLAAALTVALAVAVVVATRPDATQHRATTSTAAPTTSTSAPPPEATVPGPAPTTAAPVDPTAQLDLEAAAAAVVAPLGLSSPASWDQWLPESKPFPGPSLEEEIATCPRLASRLTEALGQEMSYWTGTLPSGPYGCTWVPVPLVYDSPDYDYVVSVGFLADGTTAGQLVGSLRSGPGQGSGPCPRVDMPSEPAGAVLVGCSTGSSTTLLLTLPDSRLPGGLWTLIVESKDRAAVPASAILPVLVNGTSAAFG